MSEVRWCHGPKCPNSARVDGKTIIVTGSNTGIGKETVRELAKRGGRVIMACRDVKKAQEAADEIVQSLKAVPNVGTVVVRRLDLASFASIREFVENFKATESRLDILINNAGICGCPRGSTENGLETQIGVNHFGPFLLTMLLLDTLKRSAPSRIVTVSSYAHSFGKIHFDDINSEIKYSPTKAYCDSKLANILFTRQLAKYLAGTGLTTYSLHPGAVSTDGQRHVLAGPIHKRLAMRLVMPFFKNPVEGAQTTIYCAVATDLTDKTGLYYSACKETTPSSRAQNNEVAKRLWDLSFQITGFNPTTDSVTAI